MSEAGGFDSKETLDLAALAERDVAALQKKVDDLTEENASLRRAIRRLVAKDTTS